MGTLNATGYVRLTKEEFRAAIFTAWRSKTALGATFVDSPDAPQTAIADSVAEALALVDESIAAAFAVVDRGSATGGQVDNLGEVIGVPRVAATKSTVTATVNLDAGVTLPAASQAADSTDVSEIYQTTVAVTNSGGSAADVSVTMEAVTAGSATFVSAGQLTVITTPVIGWNSVTNAADSTVGTDRETDPDYKLSHLEKLAVVGRGTTEAIAANIATITGVTAVAVLENTLLVPDALGIPGRAIEAVVLGGADTDVAQSIWTYKPSCTPTFGSSSAIATDASGNSQTVAFTRPTEIPIYIDFTLVTDATYVGDVAFKEAIVLSAAALFGLGDDVIYARLYELAFSVTGVVDVTLLEVGTTASPSGVVNISVDDRSLTTYDTTRIVIV